MFLFFLVFNGQRTDALPEDLADYGWANASCCSDVIVEYVSNLLIKDELVNVQGQE